MMAVAIKGDRRWP